MAEIEALIQRFGHAGQSASDRPGTVAARLAAGVPTVTVPAEILAQVAGDVPRVRGGGADLRPSAVATIAAVTVSAPPIRRMVALPPRGLRGGPDVENLVRDRLSAMHRQLLAGHVPLHSFGAAAFTAGPLASTGVAVRVIGSIAETGAKLIEYRAGEEGAVRAALPGLRLVPEVFYEPLAVHLSLQSSLQPSGSGHEVAVSVRSAATGKGIPRVMVVGFSNFTLRAGAHAFTNSKGVAMLTFAARPLVLDRVYAFPERGFWSALRTSVPAAGTLQFDLAPIDLAEPHALRHYFGEAALTDGRGVTVGVIDTGCGPHPDLVIGDGFNAVTGEDPASYGDNGDQHGTHVAGVIGSRGAAPAGVRGVAPGVRLCSYRVFPKGANASNFDVAKAIDKAREQGCDLINLSLGRPAGPGAVDEPLVRIALEDAREAGILPLAAAGNDFRRGVSFPAADEFCVAVSALGDRLVGSIGTVAASAMMAPAGADPNEFIADFSNVGPQIDLTGPGVGVVSTVPPAHFAVMDGTSLACAAVTGVAGRLLASRPAILNMPRTAARATAIAEGLLTRARPRGFGPALQGGGLAR